MRKTYLIVNEQGEATGIASVSGKFKLNIPEERLSEITHLPPEQIAEIEKIPKNFDKDGNRLE